MISEHELCGGLAEIHNQLSFPTLPLKDSSFKHCFDALSYRTESALPSYYSADHHHIHAPLGSSEIESRGPQTAPPHQSVCLSFTLALVTSSHTRCLVSD